MFLTNHSSAFLLHDVRVVKNVASLSSLMSALTDVKMVFIVHSSIEYSMTFLIAQRVY